MWNSYANCLQKINCPHCPRVFPWASFFQRHKFTHTDIHSDLETLAMAGEVLDLTAKYKELLLQREPWSTSQPQRTHLWRNPKQKWSHLEMEIAIVNGKRDRAQGEPRARRRTQHGGEHQDGNNLEEDIVSKQSLDFEFSTKLVDFMLAKGEAGTMDSQFPAQ
jgi:hypothetical protein